MQLSSRILTALAVLILAVAVVAVRAGSTGTVEAATGTIDVLNVGTCYTTDTDVFAVGACDSGDGGDYDVAGRKTILESGTVYATYAHDPKTAPDSPRGILMNSNLIKISIADSGRDKRTPVLFGAGTSRPCDTDGTTGGQAMGDDAERINCPAPDTTGASDNFYIADVPGTPEDESAESHLSIIRKDYPGVLPEEVDFRWTQRGVARTEAFDVTTAGSRVITGITIDRTDTGDGGTPEVFPEYKPMFVVDGDDSPISLYGIIDTDGGLATPEGQNFEKLNKYLAIDEDVGSGRTEGEGGEGNAAVAPWFSVRTSIPEGAAVRVMYVVYETSETEVLIGGQKSPNLEPGAGYSAETGNAMEKYAPDFTTSEENFRPR